MVCRAIALLLLPAVDVLALCGLLLAQVRGQLELNDARGVVQLRLDVAPDELLVPGQVGEGDAVQLADQPLHAILGVLVEFQ